MSRLFDADALPLPAGERTRRRALSYTWTAVAAFVVGAPAAYLISTELGFVSYTAEGTLWIEGAPRIEPADAPSVRRGWPGSTNGCIAGLCSARVLTPVILDQRLYLRVPEGHADAFASFSVADRFEPGIYQLRIDETGGQFALLDGGGSWVQTGTLASPIGQDLGFIWAPSRDALPAGSVIDFSVSSLEDAAGELASRIVTRVDVAGRVARVSLTGADPRQVAEVLSAVLGSYVDFADEQRMELELIALLGRYQPVLPDLSDVSGETIPVSFGGVACAFGRMVEEQAASSETLDVDFQRALGPGPRIVDDAKVPDRPSRDDRPLIAAFTFVACFYMGLGGFLRLSRTALMDPVDV